MERWASDGWYSVLGTRFHVRVEEATVARAVQRLLVPFRRGACAAPDPTRLDLVVGTGGYAHGLFRDGSAVARHDSWSHLVAAFLTIVNREAIAGFSGLAFHAGVVARDGRVLAFPARSGDGKSTLAAACVQAGFEYVSDEALCLDLATGAVVAYPRPLMLSPASLAMIGGPSPLVALTGDRDEVALVPEDLGGCAAGGDLRLAEIVRLHRATGPPSLHPLAGADAIGLLLGRSFNHYRHPHEAFRLVAAAARNCRVWRLECDDPRAAAALLRDRLGTPPDRAG